MMFDQVLAQREIWLRARAAHLSLLDERNRKLDEVGMRAARDIARAETRANEELTKLQGLIDEAHGRLGAMALAPLGAIPPTPLNQVQDAEFTLVEPAASETSGFCVAAPMLTDGLAVDGYTPPAGEVFDRAASS